MSAPILSITTTAPKKLTFQQVPLESVEAEFGGMFAQGVEAFGMVEFFVGELAST